MHLSTLASGAANQQTGGKDGVAKPCGDQTLDTHSVNLCSKTKHFLAESGTKQSNRAKMTQIQQCNRAKVTITQKQKMILTFYQSQNA